MGQNWRTVRIFVSSTFHDMHAERDYLFRIIYPQLKERCARQRLRLDWMDLRWGVPTEAALEVCLDAIDRCRPFFIGLLGQRYGKAQENYNVLRPEYHWTLNFEPGHSITAMEVYHAVLNNPSMARHSFFYFRDDAFLKDMPQPYRKVFLPESEQSEARLKRLKEEIRSYRPVSEYTCRYGGLEDGRVVLTGLETLGQGVLEDLWKAISGKYPVDAPEPDPLLIERQMHEAFVEERSRFFIGREREAERLSIYIKGGDRRTAVITGRPGSGKSAFLSNWSSEYATLHPEDLVLAYFVGASPDSTNHFRLLRNMCMELKRRFALKEELPEDDKKLSDTLASLLHSASQKGRIVLIIDALDQLQPQEGVEGLNWILDYLPEKARLVTSCVEEGQYHEVLRGREAEEIPLPLLTQDEQRQLVETFLSGWQGLKASELSALLAHREAGNPLYLTVALRELRFFQFYDERLLLRIKSLAEDVPGLFNQVLERLEGDLDRIGPGSGRVLVKEALTLLSCSRYGLADNEVQDLLSPEGNQPLPRALWATLACCARDYLVRRGGLIGFFHRQLDEAVKSRYPDYTDRHARLSGYFEQSPIERKLDEYPYQLQYAEDWKALASALSDLDFFLYAWDKNRKYEWMAYWRSLGGRFGPGECYHKTLKVRESQEGATPATGGCMNLIAIFLQDMGLYHEAEPLCERSLVIRKKALGPEHPAVAESLNNLAALYDDQGRFKEAEPLYERSLSIYEKVLGPEHPGVATSLNNLALLYHDQGRFKEVEPLHRKSLAIREKVLGPEHPAVAESLNNLALLYRAQGRFKEVEPLHRRSLAIREKVLGPEHPDVATSLNNLALLYHDQGNYAEAEPLYKRSLAIHEKALGPEHPAVAGSLNNLALLYHNQGRFKEVEPLHRRSLAIREKVLGPEHPAVAESLNNLALLYYAQGNYAEAEPLYKRSLAIREKALGKEHPDVATSLNNLAALYDDQGRFKEAEPLYERSLSIYEKVLGPEHPGVATSLNNLALLYHDQGRFKGAEPLLERAVRIAEKGLGSNHPNTIQFKRNLDKCRKHKS